MPAQFTVPPDTRAVGTGNPPADVNALVDTVTALGAGLNVLNGAYAGGADPTDTIDSSAAMNAAAAAVLATGQPGAVLIPPGKYRITSGISVAGAGVSFMPLGGPGSVILDYRGSGDCVRMYSPTLLPPKYGGILGGIVIDGTNAGAGAAGIHAGDLFQTSWDVTVQNFTGTGSKGAWFDNNYAWAEMIQGTIRAINCTSHVVFDHSADTSGASTGSFDRMLLKILLVTSGAGNGVVFQGGAFAIDYDLGIYGNDVYGTVLHYVLTLTGSDGAGFSRLDHAGNLNIGVELRNPGSGVQPGTINFAAQGSNIITGARGCIDFSGSAAFASSANARNSFQFEGPIFGDATLMRTFGGMNAFNAGTGLANNGQIVSQAEVNTVQPTSSLTGMILQKWGAGLGVPMRVVVTNRSSSFTITFAIPGTSNVASGTSCVIQPNTAMSFIWDTFTALWYQA